MTHEGREMVRRKRSGSRWLFGLVLSLMMVFSTFSATAYADEPGQQQNGQLGQQGNNDQNQNEKKGWQPGGGGHGGQDVHGSRYDHIDVKVDGKYTVTVDGVEYTLAGKLEAKSIKVSVGSSTYDFSRYDVTERSEDGLEYDIKVNNLKARNIEWVSDSDFHMKNVKVSATMLFSITSVPDDLKDILKTKTVGGDTYYYVDITDLQYTGVQECTGGNGMRSKGKTGIPTGLDLYITAEDLNPYITKGKLAIEKIIVDESGEVINDSAEFTFRVKGDVDPAYENTVKVRGGETVVLTELKPGSYTITEEQCEGYQIRSIDDEATTEYSKDYTVVTKEDSNIPVAQFTNTKLKDKTAVNIKKTASGLEDSARYPNPTVSIAAADSAGNPGEVIWSGQLDANGDTLYLSKYLEAGTYKVTESGADVDGYDCTALVTVNGTKAEDGKFTVTEEQKGQSLALVVSNTYAGKAEKIDIPVKKEWKGVAEDSGKIPEKITVNLLANGEKVDSKVLTEADGWTATFTEKDSKDKDGNPITYTVKEEAVDGFDTAYTEPTGEEKSWIVTNTYKPDSVKVTLEAVKKLDGKNPTTGKFSFELKAGDEVVQTKENVDGKVTFDALSFDKEGTYTYTISEKAGNDASIKYDDSVYTVTVKVSKGEDYTAEVTYTKDGKKYTVPEFNNTTRKERVLVINKTVSGNAASTSQEFCFKAKLTVDGDLIGNYEFKLKHGQSKSITLPSDGTIAFEVTESDCDGYTAYVKVGDASEAAGTVAKGEITEDKSVSVSFRNDKSKKEEEKKVTPPSGGGETTPEESVPITNTTNVAVGKVWLDSNNQDGIRPASVTVQLYRNGEAYGNPVTLSDANEWWYRWDHLDAASSWTVDELNVAEGYTKTISKNAVNAWVITNAHTPETVVPAQISDTTVTPTQTPARGAGTGDESHTMLWLVLMLASGAGVVTAVLVRRKLRRR